MYASRTALAATGGLLLLVCTPPARESVFAFETHYVDTRYGGNGKPGFVRAGDMDGDGDLDLVAGGGTALYVYENLGGAGEWARHGTLDGTGKIGANGAVLRDVDGDGDLDVVSAQYSASLGWWENPGGELKTATWAFHTLYAESYFLHDLRRADLTGDGEADEYVANLISGSKLRLRWLTPGADPRKPWTAHTIEAGRDHGKNNHAGLDAGDIDGDGHTDLAYSNGWYEAPDDPTQVWTWHEVSDVHGISNTLIRDLDGDGHPDLISSAGHHSKGVFWFENPGAPESGPWTRKTVAAALANPECLAALDLDGDGDQDIVTCDLDFARWDQPVHNVYVLANDELSWTQQNVAPETYASHELQVVDLDGDGDVDVISEGCGYSIVTYYENASGPRVESATSPPVRSRGNRDSTSNRDQPPTSR